MEANVDGYVKVGNPLKRQPFVHAPEVEVSVNGSDLLAHGRLQEALPGTELTLSIEPVTDRALRRALAGEVAIARFGLEAGKEHPLFITARQHDQSRVWTLALFMTLRRPWPQAVVGRRGGAHTQHRSCNRSPSAPPPACMSLPNSWP